LTGSTREKKGPGIMLTRGPFLDQPPMLTNIISSRNDICGLKPHLNQDFQDKNRSTTDLGIDRIGAVVFLRVPD